MKKMMLLIVTGMFLCVPAYADQVDDGIPGSDGALKAQTRAMIQAGINTEDAIGMTKAMVQQQFTHQQMVQTQQMVVTAAKNGLPVEPIMNKAKEGAAKQVPPDRVVAAMAQVSQRYAFAYAHAGQLGLQGQAQVQAGNRMAEAMAAGLNPEDCEQIANQIRSRTRSMTRSQARELSLEALAMARTASRMGVPSQNNAAMVCQALQNNYQAKDMQRLRKQFQKQARQEDAKGLANRYAHAFQHGQDPAGEQGGGQAGMSQGQGGQGGEGGSGYGGGSGGGGSGGGGR